jgi:hypothetical protein
MDGLFQLGAFVLVLWYLDVPDLCALASCSHQLKNGISQYIPSAGVYALPVKDAEPVEYPYERQGVTKVLNPLFLTTREENYHLVGNLLATLKGERFARRWLRLPCRRLTNGLCIPSYINWTASSSWHLHEFSARANNQLKWIHLKGCPMDRETLARLLSSCRAHLYHLLVTCVPSHMDCLRAVSESNMKRLRRVTFHRVQWSSLSTFEDGVVNVKLVKVFVQSRAALRLLQDIPPTLQTLFLQNIVSSDDQINVMEEIATHCRHPTSLRSFTLCSMSMSVISSSLLGSRFINLRILKIQNSNLSADMLELLLSNDKLSALTVLDLTSNLLASPALNTLGAFLSRPTCKLRRLILACNFFTSDTLVEFVLCLLHNRSLQYLDLRENFLRYVGYSILFCYLVDSPDSKITYLDLSMNQIGLEMKSDGWLPYEVGVLLSKCPRLRTLKLERNTFMAPELKQYYQQLFRENFSANVVL